MNRLTFAVAAVALLTVACAPSDRQVIAIGTGGTGGVYYPYGGGLAEVWTTKVPGVRAVAEVTGASVENVKLADRGETVIGLVMGDVAHQAYHGEGPFADDPQQVLAMAVMYPNVLQVVALESAGVDGLEQLAGRTVSTGAPGSGTAFMSRMVLEALGIGEDRIDVRRLSFVESANALKDRTIDVGIWCVAPPTSSIMDLAATHRIRVVPFSPEEQQLLVERYPYYSTYELPAGVYTGVDAPVPTLSVWNLIICTASLPEDLVYQLTKTLFESNQHMQKIHPFARYTTPENALAHASIPLHPGAIRALEELGHQVPDRLVAPAP
jgi:TRAP transporter TAXI family solute receptor